MNSTTISRSGDISHTESSHTLFNLIAEQAVLGSCLLDRDVILAVAPMLTADDFYDQDNRRVYQALMVCYERRMNPDFVTVFSVLGCAENDLGPMRSLINAMIESIPTPVYATDYARLVKEASIRRQLMLASGVQEREAATIDDPQEVAVRAAERLAQITAGLTTESFVNVRDDLPAAYDELDTPLVRPIPTGFDPLDQMIGGFLPGQLIVLGARPSVGKSALAAQVMLNVARTGRIPAIISLEMSRAEIRNRWLGILSGVNMHQHILRRNAGLRERSDHDEAAAVARAFGQLGELTIYVDDQGGLNDYEIVERAASFYSRAPYHLLVIDHLHLIVDSKRRDNRAQELGRITRGLKGLARRLNVPILLLSQLNREIEHRPENSLPQLSDLRESGAIEQDADIVLFLHRVTVQPDDVAEDVTRTARLIVAKHRNGPTGKRVLTWNPGTAEFRP